MVTHYSVQFSPVAQSCPTLCDPMNHSMPGLPVHHQLPEFTQTHAHRVSDAIQPSHPLLSPSPPALNLSQHQGLFQWVSSSHKVAKVLEFHYKPISDFVFNAHDSGSFWARGFSTKEGNTSAKAEQKVLLKCHIWFLMPLDLQITMRLWVRCGNDLGYQERFIQLLHRRVVGTWVELQGFLLLMGLF